MQRKHHWRALLFLLPALLFLTLFVLLPLLQNIYNSFFQFSVFSPQKVFIGFTNIKRLFSDRTLQTGLLNNFKYAVISVICQVGFGLALAILLEKKALRKFSAIFRVIYFIPVMISISVIALLFSFIYNPQIGLLNSFLELLPLSGLTKTWLGDPKIAIYAVIFMSQWQSTGYIMMLTTVALQKIPRELYESAEIDGAGKGAQFLHITLPQIKETLFVNTLITITGSMLVFNEPYILTKGGGPGIASVTSAVYMYQTGFIKNDMGYASAIALVIFLVTAGLALIQYHLFGSGKEA